MDDNNPFKAPEARVADTPSGDSGDFVLEGIRVPAGNGSAWLGKGWELFREAPGTWIGLTIVYVVLIMAMSIVPFLGSIATNLLLPVFIGGIMMGCKALDNGEEFTVGTLFAGFSNNGGNLMLAGLIYLGGFIAIFIVAAIIGAVFGVGAAMTGQGMSAMLIPMIIIGLLAIMLIIPLAMAIWYAPALIIFHDVQPFPAMKASFFVTLKNFWPFFIYGLVFIVLAILATLPILLGWLVLMPVMMGSVYAGYRDMFVRQ